MFVSASKINADLSPAELILYFFFIWMLFLIGIDTDSLIVTSKRRDTLGLKRDFQNNYICLLTHMYLWCACLLRGVELVLRRE